MHHLARTLILKLLERENFEILNVRGFGTRSTCCCARRHNRAIEYIRMVVHCYIVFVCTCIFVHISGIFLSVLRYFVYGSLKRLRSFDTLYSPVL